MTPFLNFSDIDATHKSFRPKFDINKCLFDVLSFVQVLGNEKVKVTKGIYWMFHCANDLRDIEAVVADVEIDGIVAKLEFGD